MASHHLATYLKDHLAGAGAAIEIMDHIESSHGDTSAGDLVKRLRPDILADRQELEELITRLGHETTAPRRAAGWLSEKVVELKLKMDDPSNGALRLLESVEMLALGVHGKIDLWHSLAGNIGSIPALGTLQYERLIQRAEAQRALIEPVRLEAASAAFVEREG